MKRNYAPDIQDKLVKRKIARRQYCELEYYWLQEVLNSVRHSTDNSKLTHLTWRNVVALAVAAHLAKPINPRVDKEKKTIKSRSTKKSLEIFLFCSYFLIYIVENPISE